MEEVVRVKAKIVLVLVLAVLLVIAGCQGTQSKNSEPDAYYWLRHMEETSMGMVRARRASVASAYFLRDIYVEQQKQTKLLEEILKELKGGGE